MTRMDHMVILVLYSLLGPQGRYIFIYGSETLLWKEKERSRIKAVQMDLRGLLVIRRIDRVLNTWIRKLCGVKEGLDEGVLWWLGHVERMESDRITKRVYVGDCAGSCSVGRLQKRWIDTVKECLRKRGMGVTQGRRMVGICEGNAWGVAQGMNP